MGADERPTAVVGLGTMGLPLALALVGAGRDVLAHDVNSAVRDRAAGRGLAVASTLADLAGVGAVVLSLPGPAAVQAVTAELAAVGPLTVFDTSTVGPDTSRAARSILAAAGGDYADCPILGRPDRVGRWTVPVGATPQLADQAARVLGPIAGKVVRVGDTGAAATLKVLNNLMLGVINAATAETLVLAQAAGLDPGVLVDTIVDSGAASVSGLFRDIGPRAVDGDFEPVFSVQLMAKDNRLALDLAAAAGLHLPVAEAAQGANQAALDAGLAAEDSIAVIKPLETALGRPARRRATAVEGGDPAAASSARD